MKAKKGKEKGEGRVNPISPGQKSMGPASRMRRTDALSSLGGTCCRVAEDKCAAK